MTTQRTSKAIAERIDITYYQRRHWLRRWKVWLSVGTLIATVALLAPATIVSRGHAIYQAGPVSAPHAFIANDCEQCHVRSWQPWKRLVTLDESHVSTPDFACRRCHDTADHSPIQIADQAYRCVDCHTEHRPDHPLLAVSDQRCTDCHVDLMTTEGPSKRKDVPSFAAHPEFAILRSTEPTDSTNLRFDHAAHLKEAGVEGPDRKPTKLACADCHQPDSERAYMRPVSFELHCEKCHSGRLAFEPELLPNKRVPHGLVEEAQAVVRKAYSEYVAEHPEVLEPDLSTKRFDPANPESLERDRAEIALRWIDERTSEAERRLFEASTGCRRCHAVDSSEQGGWAVSNAEPPDRWFQDGLFRHASHRMLRCNACHPADASGKTSDVLLPGIDNCQTCHGAGSSGGLGVRSDCVTCHEYHDHARDTDLDGHLKLDLTEAETK